MELYDFKVKTAKGELVPLSQYKNKAMLIVNVASACGFTEQYEGLQKLYEEFQAQGLEILGFPCNQFGGQEKGSNDEIQSFCTGRFGVRFPVFSKIEVNGAQADPLYQYLKSKARGFLGTQAIKWNFTKFLIGKDGKVLKRFGSATKPSKMKDAIVEALK